MEILLNYAALQAIENDSARYRFSSACSGRHLCADTRCGGFVDFIMYYTGESAEAVVRTYIR